VPTARELGVGIVAYSPFNRGLLSRTFNSRDEISDVDFRAALPRFSSESFYENKKSGDRLHDLAMKWQSKSLISPTAAKLALAWVHAQGKDVVPIPGTTKAKRLAENSEAVQLAKDLNEEDIDTLSDVIDGLPGGDRYTGMWGTFNERESSSGEKRQIKLEEL